MPVVVIGVDESGTGAVAGPYTVCAFASYEHEADDLRRLGGKDSKSVTDIMRRASVEKLADASLGAVVTFVSVQEINRDLKESWRSAIVRSVREVVELLDDRGIDRSLVKIIIDGNQDRSLRRQLLPLQVGQIYFLVKADKTVPAVGAASIFAKTERNDAMKLLHKEYPAYEWATNYGYLAPSHVEAIKRLGRTPHHRNWKIPGSPMEE